MQVEQVNYPELVAIGFEVEAGRRDLPVAVPAAWRRLFERDTGATSFLALGLARKGDLCREMVGYLAASRTEVPEGMTRRVVPAGTYLRTVHDGPLSSIPAVFEALYAYAALKGLRAGDLRLDFGYLPGLPRGRHELHIAIEAPRVLLG